MRAAQLAGPHVDGVLPTLVARLSLVARPSAGALLAPSRRLAESGTGAAPHPFARMPRTGLGAHRVKPDLLRRKASHHEPPFALASPPSTSTRWLTTFSMPRSSGPSGRSTVRPIRPRRSERSVSRCAGLVPFAERTCLITRSAPPRALLRRGGRRRLGLAGRLRNDRHGLRRALAVGAGGG